MKNRNVELINIARIDLLKGKTNINLDLLSQILLDNYATKFDKKDFLDLSHFEKLLDSLLDQNILHLIFCLQMLAVEYL